MFGGKQDPYVSLRPAYSQETKLTTKKQGAGKSATWNERFHWRLDVAGGLQNLHMNVEVYDANVGKDRLVGSVKINLIPLVTTAQSTPAIDAWYRLRGHKGSFAGDIYLSITLRTVFESAPSPQVHKPTAHAGMPYAVAPYTPSPPPQYGAPSPQYGAPSPQYGAPSPDMVRLRHRSIVRQPPQYMVRRRRRYVWCAYGAPSPASMVRAPPAMVRLRLKAPLNARGNQYFGGYGPPPQVPAQQQQQPPLPQADYRQHASAMYIPPPSPVGHPWAVPMPQGSSGAAYGNESSPAPYAAYPPPVPVPTVGPLPPGYNEPADLYASGAAYPGQRPGGTTPHSSGFLQAPPEATGYPQLSRAPMHNPYYP
ncbi:hypothetical protein FVE85_2567 [Porphyridium purpureum]|uniref:C2 domain-containing protein n=1 Tax=Porphyridium purpureum TaxID=35688 RepID=A0A5J4YKQ9_PORPP|nr:hypothetical protein FVE85_2567 [Porphyridium purpureum]|eukprot:POR1880..scf291_13